MPSTSTMLASPFSLSAGASCQWPQPGNSVGARCGSMDVLGRYKCWEIRIDSPAYQIWRAVSKSIVQLLQDQFEHLDAQDTELMVEMFMIGRKEERARPTVLFSCQSKTARQRAMDLVQKRSLLVQYPGVLMAECSRLPRALAMDELSESSTLQPGVYVAGPLRHCGASVIVVGESTGLPRKATLGGIVYISGLLYGITTAHACFEAPKTPVPLDADLEFAFYGDGSSDDSSDEGYDTIEMTSQGSISSNSTPSQTTSDPDDSNHNLQWRMKATASNPTPPLLISPIPPRKESPRFEDMLSSTLERSLDLSQNYLAQGGEMNNGKSSKLGSVFASAPEGGLDWALVAIENSSLWLENVTLNNRRFMVNSIYWRNGTLHQGAIHPRTVARSPVDVKVLICTGNSDDPLEGRLSGIASFRKAPESNSFQEMWKVKCTDGSFFEGDCGSWVIGCESGILYGIIASGYPGTSTAYIIPALQVFEDMQNVLGKQVEFSTPELWASRESAWNSGKGKSEPDLPTSPTFEWLVGRRSPKITIQGVSEMEASPAIPAKAPARRRVRHTGSLQPNLDKSPEASEGLRKVPAPLARTLNVSKTSVKRGGDDLVIQKDEKFLILDRQESPEPEMQGSSSPNREADKMSSAATATLLEHLRRSSSSSTLQPRSVDSRHHNPPCNNLYVWNYPAKLSERELQVFFERIPGYKGLRRKLHHSECFVQFEDTPSASEALVKLDGYRFSNMDEMDGMRLTFARNGVRHSPSTVIPPQLRPNPGLEPLGSDEEPESLGVPELSHGSEMSSSSSARTRFGPLLSPRNLPPPRRPGPGQADVVPEVVGGVSLDNREGDKVLIADPGIMGFE